VSLQLQQEPPEENLAFRCLGRAKVALDGHVAVRLSGQLGGHHPKARHRDVMTDSRWPEDRLLSPELDGVSVNDARHDGVDAAEELRVRVVIPAHEVALTMRQDEDAVGVHVIVARDQQLRVERLARLLRQLGHLQQFTGQPKPHAKLCNSQPDALSGTSVGEDDARNRGHLGVDAWTLQRCPQVRLNCLGALVAHVDVIVVRSLCHCQKKVWGKKWKSFCRYGCQSFICRT
jgi:hypothetical protein